MVKIIDAPMGAGKTSWVFDEINANPEKLYLCIVPYRTQITRYMDNIKVKTHTPKYLGYEHKKIDNLKELLQLGVNIIATHALFLNIDDEVVSLIKSQEYHLIIDEAVSVVSVISTGASKQESDEDNDKQIDEIPMLTREEIKWLFDNDCMEVGDDKIIKWKASPSSFHRYLWVENLAKNGGLVFINGTVLIWRFPPKIFEVVASTTILTYLFERSLLRSYMTAYNIDCSMYGITKITENSYEISSYQPDTENRKKYASLIHICKDQSLNAVGRKWGKSYPLSASWYKNNRKGKKEALKKLRDNATNFLRHRVNAARDSVMWATFKRYRDIVCPDGYKTVDEHRKELSFVACNSKATNDYINRYNLVYLCDLHINPNIVRFFETRGVTVDNSGFALSELLQWIFRSRIRKGEKINLYLPAERMRNLLTEWFLDRQSASEPYNP